MALNSEPETACFLYISQRNEQIAAALGVKPVRNLGYLLLSFLGLYGGGLK